MSKPGRIDTSGNAQPLGQRPFDALAGLGLPSGPAAPASGGAGASQECEPARSSRREPNRKRGRVDVVRQTAGRGGKTVTVASGFKGIAERELEELARTIQRACGAGGTVKGGVIEIQGDRRDRVCAVLEAAGFQPVRAGG
jgi:translation initiation factor 1